MADISGQVERNHEIITKMIHENKLQAKLQTYLIRASEISREETGSSLDIFVTLWDEILADLCDPRNLA